MTKQPETNQWHSTIGMEIHVALATGSKLFSPASSAFEKRANLNACEIDLGLPGVLPVPNRQAFYYAIRFGLAIGATINRQCEFARKHYFYPDLSKGYQISQLDYPIITGGAIAIETGDIPITRAHLEEDAGKLSHDVFGDASGVDYNRAGCALIEIVSEPALASIPDAVDYCRRVHHLVKWLGICDGNMENGSFRMDANISVRRSGEPLGVRCEIKNLNSFEFLEKALTFERERHIESLRNGERIIQQTRLFNTATGRTMAMRSKEDAQDYRYFPDPDLPPVVILDEEIEQQQAMMPPAVAQCKKQLADDQLSPQHIASLISERHHFDYFMQARQSDSTLPSTLIANWFCTDIFGLFARFNCEQCPIPATQFARLLRAVNDGIVSNKAGKALLAQLWTHYEGNDEILDIPAMIEKQGLAQIQDDDRLDAIARAIVDEFPDQVKQIKAGKDKVIGFLVGQAMKMAAGSGNPQQFSKRIKAIIDEDSGSEK